MFSLVKLLLPLFVLTPLALAAPADTIPGTISTPAAGTAIAPNATFDFAYNIRADYCKSSYSFSVWLFTDNVTATSFVASDQFATGYFFGTFNAENYPAVPYATKPAPAQLTMPDFSASQVGFGAGQSASNAKFQLVVLEEWDDCESMLGRKIGLAMNEVIYNATSTA